MIKYIKKVSSFILLFAILVIATDEKKLIRYENTYQSSRVVNTTNTICKNDVKESMIITIRQTEIKKLLSNEKTTKSKTVKTVIKKSKVKKTKINNYDGKLDNPLTQNEINMIERLVEAEATGGGVKEKSYVASVILNRLLSKEFPDSVESVVFQKHQFSPISDGRYYKVIISKDTKRAVSIVLKEGDKAHGAIFFCNPSDIRKASTQKWFSKLEYLFKDDIGHHFFK